MSNQFDDLFEEENISNNELNKNIDENLKQISEENKEVSPQEEEPKLEDKIKSNVKVPKHIKKKVQNTNKQDKENEGKEDIQEDSKLINKDIIKDKLNQGIKNTISKIKEERDNDTEFYSNGTIKELPFGVSYVEDDYELVDKDDGGLELMASFISSLILSPIRLFTETSRKIIFLGKEEATDTIKTALVGSVLYGGYSVLSSLYFGDLVLVDGYNSLAVCVGTILVLGAMYLMSNSPNSYLFKYKLYYDDDEIASKRVEEMSEDIKSTKDIIEDIKSINIPEKNIKDEILTYEDYMNSSEEKIISNFLKGDYQKVCDNFNNMADKIIAGIDDAVVSSYLYDEDLFAIE